MRALVLLGSLGAARAYNGYAVGPDTLSYQAAVSYCVSVGGEIASIHSDADNEAARDACGETTCWIGLRESGGDAGTHAFEQIWRWPDNSTAGADTYHNWAQGEPKNKDSDFYAKYEDQRHAVMNGPGYYLESSGLWFTTTDTWSTSWSTYAPLCSVNAPTTAPTLSPAPTTSPRPTYSFSCDNDRCGLSEEEDCCDEYNNPVCWGGYVPVKFGGHSCLFTCCTVAVTHEEVTASGHQWEDHYDYSSSNNNWGGGGGGWTLFILFYLFIFSGIPVIITAIIACICVRCGCCKMCLPPKLVYKDMAATPPTVPSGVELTAPATTVNAPPAQVYKASIVASEGV
jgi:hypothetical protein